MGTSTNGILAYGYDLGGDEADWKVRQVDEYGGLTLDWYDDETEFVEAAEKRLLAAAGFIETDWQVDGYFAREREAKERLGVEFEYYGSGDCSMLILAAKVITVHRGDAKLIDVTDLQREPVEYHWDELLGSALTTLGLTPTQERPGWLLTSYWG